MSTLTLALLKLGFLALLWTFVLAAVAVMRSDLYGVRRPRPAASAAARPSPAAKPSKPAKVPKPPKPARGAPTSVAVTAGSLAGRTITLGADQLTIGRAAGNTLVLDDDYVSGRHARLYPSGGAWFVEDLGSTNGTYVGKEKVTVATTVTAGAQVRIGKTVLELRK